MDPNQITQVAPLKLVLIVVAIVAVVVAAVWYARKQSRMPPKPPRR